MIREARGWWRTTKGGRGDAEEKQIPRCARDDKSTKSHVAKHCSEEGDVPDAGLKACSTQKNQRHEAFPDFVPAYFVLDVRQWLAKRDQRCHPPPKVASSIPIAWHKLMTRFPGHFLRQHRLTHDSAKSCGYVSNICEYFLRVRPRFVQDPT